jgi:GNAT superfamily N-acetyltransferase
MLVRDLRHPIGLVSCGLRIVCAKHSQARALAATFARTFGTPPDRREWYLRFAMDSRCEQFVALAGDVPAAIATLRTDLGMAWLGGAATRSRWKRRGAHAALIAARMRRARRLGCRWAWAETAEGASGSPAASQRNLMRLGFHQVHVKQTFVWAARGRSVRRVSRAPAVPERG